MNVLLDTDDVGFAQKPLYVFQINWRVYRAITAVKPTDIHVRRIIDQVFDKIRQHAELYQLTAVMRTGNLHCGVLFDAGFRSQICRLGMLDKARREFIHLGIKGLVFMPMFKA